MIFPRFKIQTSYENIEARLNKIPHHTEKSVLSNQVEYRSKNEVMNLNTGLRG